MQPEYSCKNYYHKELFFSAVKRMGYGEIRIRGLSG